ncbi:DNA-3-methyladenine glycosylase family protein [Polyangium aurulentum]|uniref:DNA-3-methyladenine glycosylase family protein n=1 Tax=Polyangium aurulentum TaxID=2567896 RepID=UPI0010AE5F40|nr:DNA-3-methyladenine glycosylase [Polyangium aurulentum]UQA60317.1 DNA-3-methyladenine glycosylase [Polyangium aurulentum]
MNDALKSPHAEAMRALSLADARLGAVIADVGPCRLGVHTSGPFHTPGYFESLVESIVSQQLSVKAADTIFGRVVALGGGKLPPPAELLVMPEETLRGAGLSGPKIKYLRDLCEKVTTGALVLEELSALEDEAVIERLRAVKGVGRWTAEMFLIFRLGRPDVLPVADLGIQKGMKLLFNLRKDPVPERMEKLAKPWRPYRSIACWYLWRLYERSRA